MWIRKCYIDDESDIQSPIPNCISSNEEFVPPPQSAKEREVENRLRVMADKNAKRLGLSRRGFLQTSCGMAAAMICFNEVFGKTYEVEAAEALDPAAYKEKWPKNEFIFDNQTHHIDVETGWFEKTQAGREAAEFLRRFRPNEKSTSASLEALNEAHYVKELFFDSDTTMSIISGVPSSSYQVDNILPPDKMVKTRNDVNGWAHSQRMLSHGLLRPNFGPAEFEEMQRQKEELKIDSWKMYTGAEIGKGGWWLDDEKTTYPFWERSRKIGIKNLCVHKGLPLGLFNETYCNPRDVEKAAKDFPDMNFIIYHSAWHPTAKINEEHAGNPQYIPWVSDLMDIVKRNNFKNVYFELGSTWNGTSSARPEVAMHLFGQLLNMGVEDQIIWGTDSIWGGSPQSQIERFRRFQIRDDIAEKYGYKKLTPELKAKVFGLNAARIYKVDVNAKRSAIENDKIAQEKQEYRQRAKPSNTQYGWVWRG
ncbi:MAG TPA: amidohydrolase family protein [Blastocatellia bacterium]|nr:amidohydrolase family protein [Blastocatellia bacterium]